MIEEWFCEEYQIPSVQHPALKWTRLPISQLDLNWGRRFSRKNGHHFFLKVSHQGTRH